METNALRSFFDDFHWLWGIWGKKSHENLSKEDVSNLAKEYENQFNIPAADILEDGCQKIIDSLLKRFPELKSSEAWSLCQDLRYHYRKSLKILNY